MRYIAIDRIFLMDLSMITDEKLIFVKIGIVTYFKKKN